MQYVHPVNSRIREITREYWFELLIAAMAIAGMLELIVGRNSPGAPASSLWFSIPALWILVAPLFLRRRFPFAAPAAYWLMAAGLSYVDGLLIPFIGSLGVVGLASVAGKTGWGALSDRFGREPAYTLAFACVVASVGVLVAAGAAGAAMLAYACVRWRPSRIEVRGGSMAPALVSLV